MPLTIAM
jgi:hypothetical protein